MLELKFTETYRKWENGPKPLRELECLKVQFPAILQPVRDTGQHFYAGSGHRIYHRGDTGLL